MRKPLRLLIAGLIGAGLLGWFLWVSFHADPVLVDLHEIASGPMQVTVDVDGKTRIREVYEIAAPITGVARRSPVAVGDRVVAGETVIAVVEPTAPGLLDARSRLQADAAVQEAAAALEVARSDLTRTEEEQTHAQAHYDRSRTLLERGVASLTQLEDAGEKLAIANAAVEAARARITMAEGSLARVRATLVESGASDPEDGACCVPLTAPSDGVVLSVDVVSARPVTAGMRLASVGDPADLEIVADLLSTDAVRLASGAPAIVERWGGAPLEAELVRIYPSARTEVSALGIEEQRVDALFSLTSPAEGREGLADGFAVFLRIVEWQADDVLQVPLSATFRLGEAWGVFAVSNGVAQLRAVDLGRRNARVAQVLSGLQSGDLVVTHPNDALSDGKAVRERVDQ
ncbi:efflux RND transporter periplasmic adaptor subunit [Roseisalinus antarcticus]|uniref:Macrolide export protein MacA n=1 Tax=Roseisalinus antarcticus TaxID=254357 RepID=A0A1Y5RMV3_9RHOB|nr:HlyD family efflux transporter periplasmic adaptor subunit [Roseisalinus antarcticus]SLN20208.1 Macrolide export protein MacA [Roseisalinus antarcticus]